MAIRTVRTVGDRVLEKKCREVKEMTPKIEELIDDMFDTMYEYNGVGLAAPQVGVLKRIIVVDTGDDPRVLINPVIVESDGTQTGLRVLTGTCSPSVWRERVFLPEISAMRSIISTDICTWSSSRVKSTM